MHRIPHWRLSRFYLFFFAFLGGAPVVPGAYGVGGVTIRYEPTSRDFTATPWPTNRLLVDGRPDLTTFPNTLDSPSRSPMKPVPTRSTAISAMRLEMPA